MGFFKFKEYNINIVIEFRVGLMIFIIMIYIVFLNVFIFF